MDRGRRRGPRILRDLSLANVPALVAAGCELLPAGFVPEQPPPVRTPAPPIVPAG